MSSVDRGLAERHLRGSTTNAPESREHDDRIAVEGRHLAGEYVRITLLDVEAVRNLVFYIQPGVETQDRVPMSSGFRKQFLGALHVVRNRLPNNSAPERWFR